MSRYISAVGEMSCCTAAGINIIQSLTSGCLPKELESFVHRLNFVINMLLAIVPEEL